LYFSEKKEEYMHIGQKIKKLRQLKGYTQAELSGKINKTRALLSHIELSGKINHYTFLAILKFFGMSEDDFDRFDETILITGDPGTKYYDKKDITLLKQKLENCQNENEMLKEIIGSQKKIIGMMEKKKRS
jgi:transcriptional regulator with XRE-family HTH domain